jgi:hypothetical protein
MGITKIRAKGFAISLDTLFAIVILIALTSYVGLGLRTETQTTSIAQQTNSKQMLDDTITAMDNNGIIGRVFVDNTGDPLTNLDANTIYFEMKKLLPENMDLNIQIEQYEQKTEALTECKSTKQFDDCFQKVSTATGGNQIPENKEIYTGSQTFMKRQPYLKDNIANSCIIETEQKNKKNTALQLDDLSTITTKVNATNTPPYGETPEPFFPASTMYCYDSENGIDDNEIATVTISEKSGFRSPIAIMTIMDKSGSMSKLDMRKSSYADGPFNNGTCLPDPPGTCTIDTPSNCGTAPGYTDWILGVGSFNITSAMRDKLSSSASGAIYFWNRYTTKTDANPYVCSSAKIRLWTPNNPSPWYSEIGRASCRERV